MPTNNLRYKNHLEREQRLVYPSIASSTCHVAAIAGGQLPPSNSYKEPPTTILTVLKEYPNKNPIHGNIIAVHLGHKWEGPPRPLTLPAPDTSLVQNRRIPRCEWSFWALISEPNTALGFSWCFAWMTGKTATEFVPFLYNICMQSNFS